MKTSKVVKQACRVLRRNVRFKNANLRIDRENLNSDDTQKIREATRLYVESWIIPIIDMIEQGKTQELADFTDRSRGDDIGTQ